MALMDAFRPKWKNGDWKVREAAANSLSDRDVLAEIAAMDQHEAVRRAAVRRLLGVRDRSVSFSEGLRARKHAADLLDGRGWRPDGEEEKILYYLAKDQLDACAHLGAHALPLLTKAYEAGLLPSMGFRNLIERFDSADAVPSLIELLRWAIKHDDGIRIRTVSVLIRIGEPVVKPLNRALSPDDESFADGGALTILYNIAENKRRAQPAPLADAREVQRSAACETAALALVLTATGPLKINVMKAIRELTGLGLHQLSTFVDHLPQTITRATNRAEAEAIAERFREIGATVKIEE